MTESFLLRDVLEDDLPILFEHQRDPEACAMAAFPPRDRDAFMEHWRKILGDQTVQRKAILVDGQVAGYLCCFERGGKRQVGYWIGRDFWGRGIATRGLAEFLDHVRERPLFAYVAKHNKASLRVAQKCGFELHGESLAPCAAGQPVVEEFVLRLG